MTNRLLIDRSVIAKISNLKNLKFDKMIEYDFEKIIDLLNNLYDRKSCFR